MRTLLNCWKVLFNWNTALRADNVCDVCFPNVESNRWCKLRNAQHELLWSSLNHTLEMDLFASALDAESCNFLAFIYALRRASICLGYFFALLDNSPSHLFHFQRFQRTIFPFSSKSFPVPILFIRKHRRTRIIFVEFSRRLQMPCNMKQNLQFSFSYFDSK